MGNKSAKIRTEELNYCSRNTRFNNNQIKQWFKSFHKDCPDGYLTNQQFQLIYAQYFPHGDPSDFARHVFRCFDMDQDGKVSFKEFLTTLSLTAYSTQEDKIQWAFYLYDIDGDNFISRDEMLEIVKSIYKLVGKAVMMPQDESTPEKRTKKIFNQFDQDRDGKLSYDDFKRLALADPSIVRLLSEVGTNSNV